MANHGRVFITGCGGMLGNAIYPYFLSRSEAVLATDRVVSEPWLESLDVRDTDALRRHLDRFQPDLVLHLAAETDLEYCESHPAIAEATNSLATRELSRLVERRGVTLVYISTAGVFDGRKDTPYTEADAPNPIMVYGRTKLDGEVHVRTWCSRHYVIRAGWMVGGGRGKDKKFVAKILRQLSEGRTVIHAVDDKWGTPTYTHDFAMNLFRLLESGQSGTYHMVCEGSGTRFDIARHIVGACGREDVEVRPVSSDFFKEQYFAPRPRSESMVNANLHALGLNGMRSWKEALSDYLRREYPHLAVSTRRAAAEAVVGAAAASGA